MLKKVLSIIMCAVMLTATGTSALAADVAQPLSDFSVEYCEESGTLLVKLVPKKDITVSIARYLTEEDEDALVNEITALLGGQPHCNMIIRTISEQSDALETGGKLYQSGSVGDWDEFLFTDFDGSGSYVSKLENDPAELARLEIDSYGLACLKQKDYWAPMNTYINGAKTFAEHLAEKLGDPSAFATDLESMLAYMKAAQEDYIKAIKTRCTDDIQRAQVVEFLGNMFEITLSAPINDTLSIGEINRIFDLDTGKMLGSPFELAINAVLEHRDAEVTFEKNHRYAFSYDLNASQQLAVGDITASFTLYENNAEGVYSATELTAVPEVVQFGFTDLHDGDIVESTSTSTIKISCADHFISVRSGSAKKGVVPSAWYIDGSSSVNDGISFDYNTNEIIIPAEALERGTHTVTVEFVKEEFVYPDTVKDTTVLDSATVIFDYCPDRGQNAINILVKVAELISYIFQMIDGMFGGLFN
ncbi:MAG: hypothetical protein GX051_03795 [Clostridiales bacterium]|nr:hypothetical protein [Clostridiales bacterium]